MNSSSKRVLVACGFLLTIASLTQAQDLPVMDGLALWLDATDASTVFQDFDLDEIAEPGDFVSSWADKSGNEYHAFTDEDGGAGDPLYEANGINGLPSVQFSGEFADGMIIDGLDLQRPYTAFIANQYYGELRGRTLQSQDINWLAGMWSGSVAHFAEGWVTSVRPVAEANRPYVSDAVGTETSSRFFVNGVDWTLDDTPVGVPGALALGGAGLFPLEVSDADISEVIIYDRVLSDTELGLMRTHLYDKYGTTTIEEPPLPPEFIVHKGEVAQFMSAADLDFSGDFIYAINAGGPAENEFGEALVIGDAEFSPGTLADQLDLDDMGAVISQNNEAAAWYQDPDYGDTVEDDNLETIMQSIRWNGPPGVTIDLDVEEGESYKLQMLFAEEAWDRGFDITMEGEEVVSDFIIHRSQDGMGNREVGVSYTHELVAGDDVLNISLGGFVNVPDNNALFQGLTLEKIEAIITACNPDTQGDLDGNGIVEFADFLTLSSNFGQAVSDAMPGHEQGDINCTGEVDFADFLTLSSNFGMTIEGAESVPEPSAWSLFGLAALLLGCVRRRR